MQGIKERGSGAGDPGQGIRGRGSVAGYQRQGIRDRGSGAGDQEQGIRGRGSGIGDQGKGIRASGWGTRGSPITLGVGDIGATNYTMFDPTGARLRRRPLDFFRPASNM